MINNPFQISNIAPDLNRIETKSINVIYQAARTGYVVMYATPGWNGNAQLDIAQDAELSTNTVTMFLTGGSYYDSENERGGGNCIVRKGDYFKAYGAGIQWVKFIPCKGA